MKYTEALTLEKGDLVVISKRNKSYGGLVLEIESVNPKHEVHRLRVTLKQPGFNNGFRIENYDTRLLQRFET